MLTMAASGAEIYEDAMGTPTEPKPVVTITGARDVSGFADKYRVMAQESSAHKKAMMEDEFRVVKGKGKMLPLPVEVQSAAPMSSASMALFFPDSFLEEGSSALSHSPAAATKSETPVTADFHAATPATSGGPADQPLGPEVAIASGPATPKDRIESAVSSHSAEALEWGDAPIKKSDESGQLTTAKRKCRRGRWKSAPGPAEDNDLVVLQDSQVVTECRTIEDVEDDQKWGRLLGEIVQRKRDPTLFDWDLMDDTSFNWSLMDEQEETEKKAEVIESAIRDGRLTKIQGESLGVAWDMILVEYQEASKKGDDIEIFIRRKPSESKGLDSIAALGEYAADQIEGLIVEGGYFRIKNGVTMDSGSSVFVMPSNWLSMFALEPSPGSISGQTYQAAAKGSAPIKSEGQRTVKFVTRDGQKRKMVCQVAAVNKILASIGQICDGGNEVLFRYDGGEVINLQTGMKTPFRRLGNVYVMDAWIAKDQIEKGSTDVNMDFSGPEDR